MLAAGQTGPSDASHLSEEAETAEPEAAAGPRRRTGPARRDRPARRARRRARHPSSPQHGASTPLPVRPAHLTHYATAAGTLFRSGSRRMLGSVVHGGGERRDLWPVAPRRQRGPRMRTRQLLAVTEKRSGRHIAPVEAPPKAGPLGLSSLFRSSN